MDIVAHMLWAGAGTVLATRRSSMTRRTVVATVALAALPDVLQFVPVMGWTVLGDGSWRALALLATALPGHEPPLPGAISLLSHHLHCFAHSAVTAGVLTAAVWVAARSIWIPLLGWWSHILIDVVTHSADFYPAPVLYHSAIGASTDSPGTRRGSWC